MTAVDHFLAGTKFHRLDVPLRVEDANGRYRRRSGTLKIIYGCVIAKTGTRRVG